MAALLAFKASGGAANDAPLASWRNGTDPCGGTKWRGVTCSGGAVTRLELGNTKVSGDVGGEALLEIDGHALEVAEQRDEAAAQFMTITSDVQNRVAEMQSEFAGTASALDQKTERIERQAEDAARAQRVRALQSVLKTILRALFYAVTTFLFDLGRQWYVYWSCLAD